MVRVALVGYGAIGTGILGYCLERGDEVQAVVDTDPTKVGRTIRELTGQNSDVRVLHDVRQVNQKDLDVAIFATKSRLGEIADDIEFVLGGGVSVVSTCEELAYPLYPYKHIAKRLDAAARGRKVSVVGVGVNPGFIMDWVPAVVASASKNPSRIQVTRSVDVSRRRKQLQGKMGVGKTKEEFAKGLEAGSFGHVGLVESLHLLAASLGEEAKEVTSGIAPVLGADDYVMGARQFAEGKAGVCLIRLDLEMTVTSTDFDLIEVVGDPHLKLRFENGVFGDSATVALTVNAAERILGARPGLLTVLELPIAPPERR